VNEESAPPTVRRRLYLIRFAHYRGVPLPLLGGDELSPWGASLMRLRDDAQEWFERVTMPAS